MRKTLLLLAASVACWSSSAQDEAIAFRDDITMDAYLAMLAQIAPAARDGAEAYIAAYRRRCGRELSAIELRRAFAAGEGDPTLLGMVRASQQRDAAAVERLTARVECARK